MPTPRALSERIAATPFASDTTHRVLDLTSSDTSLSLAPGAYEAFLDGTTLAFVRHGSAVSIPSSGDPEVTGQYVVPPGGAVTFVVDSGAATLHARMSTGTGTLHLMRKPL